MPVYEYLCCNGHVTTEFRSVAERRRPTCCRCGERAARAIVTPPRVCRDLAGYESPASGKWVEGRRQRAEDLARTGCRPYEAGEREEAEKRRAARDAALDRHVDLAVEQTLSELVR